MFSSVNKLVGKNILSVKSFGRAPNFATFHRQTFTNKVLKKINKFQAVITVE